MCNETKLKEFLEQISKGAKFTKFEYESKERFIVRIVCKVAENQPVEYYNGFAKDWIDKFSTFTCSGWAVTNCFPHIKRTFYRTSYYCLTPSKKKSVNFECKAKIEFTAELMNKNPLRNNWLLHLDQRMCISIVFRHTHIVNNNDIVCSKFLKCSPQTNAIFNKYFKEGYTVSTAKCYHELRLIEKYGEESDQFASTNMNPSLRPIYCLYRSQPRPKLDGHKLMVTRFQRLEQAGYTIKYSYDPLVVVILTPFMKRVILQIGVEEVLVDATLVYGTPFTMFLYVPSKIGSIPIACVIYEKLSEPSYTRIFFTVKLALESECNVHFEPKLLVVGDKQERDALTLMFPNAEIKLNQFTLCREIWKWVTDNDSGIKPTAHIQHDVMGLFKTLIYATSMEEAEGIYGSLKTTTSMGPCLGKLEEIWEDRYQWIGNWQCRGFSEAPLAFMREVILQRCTSFNICEMIDFVTNILERHYNKIIEAYTDGGATAMYMKFLPKFDLYPGCILRLNPNEYILRNQSEQGNNKKRTQTHVNINTMCCVCIKGKAGRLCEHLCSVLTFIGYESLVSPLSEDDKELLLKLVDNNPVITDDLDFGEPNQMPVEDNDQPLPVSSEASDDCRLLGVKSEDVQDTKEDIKVQYEGAMKSVNDEFRRLSKLFKDNPNRANLETMMRLATELGKIRPVEKVNFSKMFIELNRASD